MRRRGRVAGRPSRGVRALALGACLLFVLLSSRPTHGDDEPARPLGEQEVRERAPGWIEDLRSPSFAVRERARAALEANALHARDALVLHKDDEDPEVRRTVRALLDGLGREEPPPPPEPGDLRSLGRVTLSGSGPPAEVLRRLGATQGATFTLPDPPPGGTVEGSFQDEPFFSALATLASVMGLDASAAFDAAGALALRPAPGTPGPPGAASGAFRVLVSEVTATRRLDGEDTRRYQLALDLDWTPAVQLVSYRQPQDLAAQTSAGLAYRPGAAMRSNVTYGVGTGTRRARLTLYLDPPEAPDAEERLAELAFTLPLRIRRDARRVRLDAAAPRPVTVGGDGQPAPGGAPTSITLEGLEQPDGEQGPWVADVVVLLPGETARRSVQAYLEQEDGELRPTIAGARTQSADGVLRLTLRAYGKWEAPPRAVVVEWFATEEEGEVSFTLRDVPLR